MSDRRHEGRWVPFSPAPLAAVLVALVAAFAAAGCDDGVGGTAQDALGVCGKGNVEAVDEPDSTFECRQPPEDAGGVYGP